MFTSFKRRIRNIFITGLLITLPIAFTIFILNFLFKTLDNWLSPMITKLLIWARVPEWAGIPIPDPEKYRIPGLGVIMTIIFIFLIGVLTRSFLGSKLVQLGEMIVDRIPFVRNIYTGVKQIVTTIANADTKAFRKVVILEFPRKGLYSMGFITTENRGEVQALTEENVVNVFVPTTPNPTSGFLIFAPQNEVTELSMTVEEGIKFIISCGIVTPKYQQEKLLEIKEKYSS